MPDFHHGREHLLNVFQVYPVAYLEFIAGEDGKRRRIGPMGEKEEMAARDAWQVGTPTEWSRTRSECVIAFPRTGEEGCRSYQVQERTGSSDLNPRRLRG